MPGLEDRVAEILERGEGRYLIMGMVQAHGMGLRSLARALNVPVEALATIEIEGFGRVPHPGLVRKIARWIEERGLDPEELVEVGRARFRLEYEWDEVREELPEELREELEGKHPVELGYRTLLRVARALS